MALRDRFIFFHAVLCVTLKFFEKNHILGFLNYFFTFDALWWPRFHVFNTFKYPQKGDFKKVKIQFNYMKDFRYIFCKIFIDMTRKKLGEMFKRTESNMALFWSTQRTVLVVTCARFFAQCTLLYENMYTVKCVKNCEIAATYSSFIKCVWSPSYVGPALVKKTCIKISANIFMTRPMIYIFISTTGHFILIK